MGTLWTLKEFLDAHEITPNALSTRTAGQLARNTVYNLVRKQPKRVELKTFNVLITTLEKMTGEEVSISDLITYQPDPHSAFSKEQDFLFESGLDYLQGSIDSLEGDSQQYKDWLESFTKGD